MDKSTHEVKNMTTTQLRKDFNKGHFKIGASTAKQCCWYFISILFFQTGLIPFSNVLVFILRIFGAVIGKDVRIKPGIRIKYPWKLTIEDHAWLDHCIIENLDHIYIGKNACVSINCMLLTGNHDYKASTFSLITKPVVIQDGAWVASGAIVCPGITIYTHAVLKSGSVATKDLEAFAVYQGNPAIQTGLRMIKSE